MRSFLAGFGFICIFAFSLEAFASYPPLPDGAVVYWSKSGTTRYYSSQGTKDPQDDLRIFAEERLPSCQAAYPDMECAIQGYNDDAVKIADYTWGGGGSEMEVKGYIRIVAIPVQQCEQSTRTGSGMYHADSLPVSACDNGCSVNYSGTVTADGISGGEPGSGTETYHFSNVTFEYTGQACESNDDNAPIGEGGDTQPDAPVCGEGEKYGEVNGETVCVPAGDDSNPDDGSDGGDGSGGGDGSDGGDGSGGDGSGDGSGNGSGGGGGTGTGEEGDGVPPAFTGHQEPASWWESEYPEGASGIATKFSEDMGNGPFMSMLDPLKGLPSSGSAPSWTINVNLGPMGNFGAVNLSLPSGVWAFIRFCILFTAVMTCRKLIFGG
jgi:hypothetical protein